MSEFSGTGDVSAQGLLTASQILTRPAEEFGNDSTVEALWAMKAFDHAAVYFNLLCSIDPKNLKLTKHDDKIYSDFRDLFPTFDIALLNEDEMKSSEGKEKWRPFCDSFKDILEDFNVGTLLRVDCTKDYSEENSCIVPRVQFWAIEIARNREGYNDKLRSTFKPQPRVKRS
uniref:EOG090X0HAI n=1 Tax=Lynceus sp. MCZ IZ 141354 TaxID=1930659 RepID=A0A9N6WTL3_9CRUS|nr:EOG090X0HAI [Lynceus sp. MCZ IZ 141354]